MKRTTLFAAYQQKLRRRQPTLLPQPAIINPPSTVQPWTAASTGGVVGASNLNQLLGTHAVTYLYYQNAMDDILTAVSGTLNTNTGSAPQWIAQAFNTGAAALNPTLGHWWHPYGLGGTGSDIVVEIRTNNAGVPSNTVLFSITIPVDFMQSAITWFDPTTNISGWLIAPAIALGLTTNTTYWAVVRGTASTTNFVKMQTTTAVANKHAFTSPTGTGSWSDAGVSCVFVVGDLNKNVSAPPNANGTLVAVYEDQGARWWGFMWGDNQAFDSDLHAIGEYNGAFRSVRTLTYSQGITNHRTNGALISIL